MLLSYGALKCPWEKTTLPLYQCVLIENIEVSYTISFSKEIKPGF